MSSRRTLSSAAPGNERQTTMKFVTQDYYEILNVAPAASNEDVKRAYRQVRQSFRPDSMAMHSLYSAEETEAIAAKIDEAFRILSNGESARRYDKYHRTGRVGRTVPRDADRFFDQVHALDEPSPIELLAHRLGRKRAEEAELADQTPLMEAETPTSTFAPVAGPTPIPLIDPSQLLVPEPMTLPVEPQEAVASVEILLDSLEEVPELEPSWSAPQAPSRVAAQIDVPDAGPAPWTAGMPSMLSAAGPKLSSVRGRGLDVPQLQPRTDPTTRELPGAQVTSPQQATTLARIPAVAAATKLQDDERSRRWHRETVRTRAVGPLSVSSLSPDILEAFEMDCGGVNGEYLRQVRRELDVSLQDIATRTKIGLAMLRYIEDDRIDDLPAKVYLKGYLSQMCRLLKLPVPETPDRYLAGHDLR